MSKIYLFICIVLTICFWGGSYVAGRLLSPGLDSAVVSCVRVVIAFITLICLCLAGKVKLMPSRKKDLLPLFVLGFVGIFLYTLLFHLGIKSVPGGRTAVIINVNPIIIAIGAALFLHDKLTPLRFGGVLLAAFGAAVVISHGHLTALFSDKLSIGDLWLLLAAVCAAFFALLGKELMQRGLRPIQIITWTVFFGMLCFIVMTASQGNLGQIADYTLTDWLCLIYLGMFSTSLIFVVFYKILGRLGATGGGVIPSMVPIPAIIFTALFLHEPLTASLVVGAAITVLGVLLVNIAPRKNH